MPHDILHSDALQEFERRFQRIKVKEVRGLGHVKSAGIAGRCEIFPRQLVELRSAFNAHPVQHGWTQAVLEPSAKKSKPRTVGAQQPFVPAAGKGIDREGINVDRKGPDRLGGIHHQKRVAPGSRFADGLNIDLATVPKAHIVESHDPGAGCQRRRDFLGSWEAALRVQNLHFYPALSQVQPG